MTTGPDDTNPDSSAAPEPQEIVARHILEQLWRAGLAVVPRQATQKMIAAANALPVTAQVDGLIGDIVSRNGGVTHLPASPDTPLEQWWRAMVDEAQK